MLMTLSMKRGESIRNRYFASNFFGWRGSAEWMQERRISNFW